MIGWSVQWRSGPNNVDKKVNRHLVYPMPLESYGTRRATWTARHPVWFSTRKEAREWRDKHYGYIAARPDLRAYPHDWKPPVVVRATLVVQEVERAKPKRPCGKRRRAKSSFPGLTARDLADALCHGSGHR